MTRAPIDRPLPQGRTQDKFTFEKATSGSITSLMMHGVLDQTFEGKKVGDVVHTKKVVVNMHDVRRFASWGMSEWMDFLRINAGRDLYLVECSTYAMSQINLVTGLLGHSKLVSFYASYRCGSCGEERESLLLVPRDRAIIRDLPSSQQECAACGGHARLEDYPAAFFEKVADRPAFDIDDEVLAFLRAQLKYDLTPDLTRFRAYRRVHKEYTYLRLSGNLAALPSEPLAAASEGTTIADLSGIVFDPGDVSAWRTYVRAALAKVTSLQLLDCPLGFAESAMTPEDLGDKLKVRTLALPYDCLRCETTTAYMVDVAEHLEQLAAGVAPGAICPTCQTALVASLSSAQIAFLRALPARDRDPALDKFLAAARADPLEKLENCLAPLASRPAKASSGGRRVLYGAFGLGTLILGGLVVVALGLWKQGEPARAVVPEVTGPPVPPPKPAIERPEWILSDLPGSAYCHDMINRLMCVGVSSYRPTRDEAVAEANDAALEELVAAIGLKISEPFFRDKILPAYSEVRAKAISALQAVDPNRDAAAEAAARSTVAGARKRVAEILLVSGGPAVPAQKSDWHWEEYAAKQGGTETLAFVRYDVSVDAIKALVEKFSATSAILGSSTTTAFPALAWQSADFAGGVMVTKVGRPLADAGVAPASVIMAVGEQRVGDAAGLARRLDEWKQGTGELALTVKTADAPARVVEIPRRRVK